MFAHEYNIIIDSGVGAPVHDREVVGGFNAKNKRFLSMLMKTVQLPGSEAHESHRAMYSSTATAHCCRMHGTELEIDWNRLPVSQTSEGAPPAGI